MKIQWNIWLKMIKQAKLVTLQKGVREHVNLKKNRPKEKKEGSSKKKGHVAKVSFKDSKKERKK